MVAKLRHDFGVLNRELCANGTYRVVLEAGLLAFLTALFAEFELPQVPTWARLGAAALVDRTVAEMCR